MAAKDMFTDAKRVKDLVKLMADNDLIEVELVEDKSKITLKRANPYAALSAPPALPSVSLTHASAAPAAVSAPPVDAEADQFVTIKSPMVGTFYVAANPESDAYVTIGSQVGEETVVCIIEAMKVFNEIRAETTGTIAKILVQNGQAIEFNQPLFLVKPG